MCRVFEETWMEGKEAGLIEGRREGRLEGRLEGQAEVLIETGLEFGLTKEDILERLQNKLNVSLSKAQDYFTMFSNKPFNL